MILDIKAETLSLLEQIINTTEEGLIQDIKSLLNSRSLDWFDELNEAQQNDV